MTRVFLLVTINYSLVKRNRGLSQTNYVVVIFYVLYDESMNRHFSPALIELFSTKLCVKEPLVREELGCWLGEKGVCCLNEALTLALQRPREQAGREVVHAENLSTGRQRQARRVPEACRPESQQNWSALGSV